MKPLIGITCSLGENNDCQLSNHYVKAVIRAGGLPILLPVGLEDDVEQLTVMLDGLLLTGGGDIDPVLFNEEPHPFLGEVSPSRDIFEIRLVQEFMRVDKPMLGICRGLQIMNVAVGGNMYQDIHSQIDHTLLQHIQKAPRNHQSHFIRVKKGSLLESITACCQLKVNSFHHQAVKDVPKPLVVSGVTSDGIIEAIESTEHTFMMGVQWHPEELWDSGDIASRHLFEKFLGKCNQGRLSEGGKV